MEIGVKVLWFHLMPYDELPDDFAQTHPSVWVDVDSRLFDPVHGHELYHRYIDELEFAADCGFDAICVNEHHANAYGLMPSPNLIASILTRKRSDAAICVLGNSIALYNPPTRVAEEFAVLDVLSGGRLIAGFPTGTPMDTCYAYGQNPSQLRDRYMEAHDLIVRSWKEPAAFSFAGRYNQQRYVNVWPRPIQKPHPPIWIPGGGSIETWRWCAEMDYVYCYLTYFGYKQGAATIQGFWDEMRRLGKDENPYRIGFLQFVGVAETREQALEIYREPAEYFYGRCLHLDPSYVSPPGYVTEGTMRSGIESQLKKGGPSGPLNNAARATEAARTMNEIVDRGYIIIGSPDEVTDQLAEIATEFNVGHLLTLLQFGNMSTELARYNTQLFAEKVLPRLRPLFAEWEDKWWPQGCAPMANSTTEQRAKSVAS